MIIKIYRDRRELVIREHQQSSWWTWWSWTLQVIMRAYYEREISRWCCTSTELVMNVRESVDQDDEQSVLWTWWVFTKMIREHQQSWLWTLECVLWCLCKASTSWVSCDGGAHAGCVGLTCCDGTGGCVVDFCFGAWVSEMTKSTFFLVIVSACLFAHYRTSLMVVSTIRDYVQRKRNWSATLYTCLSR